MKPLTETAEKLGPIEDLVGKPMEEVSHLFMAREPGITLCGLKLEPGRGSDKRLYGDDICPKCAAVRDYIRRTLP